MYCAHAFIQTKLLCVYTESHLWLKKRGQMLRFLCAPRRRYFFSAAVKDGGFGAVSHTWVACGLLHTLVRSAWSASSSWRRRGGTEAVALIGWSRADGDPFYWEEITTDGGETISSFLLSKLPQTERLIALSKRDGRAGDVHSVPAQHAMLFYCISSRPVNCLEAVSNNHVFFFWVFKFVENSWSKDGKKEMLI